MSTENIPGFTAELAILAVEPILGRKFSYISIENRSFLLKTQDKIFPALPPDFSSRVGPRPGSSPFDYIPYTACYYACVAATGEWGQCGVNCS